MDDDRLVDGRAVGSDGDGPRDRRARPRRAGGVRLVFRLGGASGAFRHEVAASTRAAGALIARLRVRPADVGRGVLVPRQRLRVPCVGQGRVQASEGMDADRLATARSQVSTTSARAPGGTHGHVSLCFSDATASATGAHWHDVGAKKKT